VLHVVDFRTKKSDVGIGSGMMKTNRNLYGIVAAVAAAGFVGCFAGYIYALHCVLNISVLATIHGVLFGMSDGAQF